MLTKVDVKCGQFTSFLMQKGQKKHAKACETMPYHLGASQQNPTLLLSLCCLAARLLGAFGKASLRMAKPWH